MPTEFEIVLGKLDRPKKTSNGYDAFCPCHEDTKRSLGLAEGRDGKALLHCRALCNYADIAEKLELRRNGNSVEPKIVVTYDYTGLKGQLLYQVVRYEPKAFKHRRPDGNGGWIWNLEGIIPTLYRIQSVILGVANGDTIFVVEGEKDVDNLRKYGLVATTISGGASVKWPPELLPVFEEAKVCVIPDNDASGLKYAQYVATMLSWIAQSVKMLILPYGKDASDYLEKTPDSDLLAVVSKIPTYVPKGLVTMDVFNAFTGLVRYQQKQISQLKSRKLRSKYG